MHGFREMIHGKVSVFNYAGDFAHFANPEVTFIPVEMRLLQVEQSLSYDCINNQGNDIDPQVGQVVVRESRGSFRYDPSTKQLTRSSNGAKKSNTKRKPLKCLQKVAIMADKASSGKPQRRRKKADAIKMSRFIEGKYPELVENRETLSQIMPVMAVAIEQLEKDRRASKHYLQQYYEHLGDKAPRRNQRMRYLKQTLHIDFKSYLDRWGSKLITYLLSLAQFGGYKRINKRLKISDYPYSIPPENYIEEADDYKGMIVMDGALNDPRFDKYRKACIDYFNASDNVDGKKCILLVNTWRFREGISLRDVYAMHMIGYFTSRAYVVQGGYRAIRNCSHRRLPYHKGWKIKIRMYTPTYPGSKLTGINLYNLMDESTQQAQMLQTEMKQLMIENAYDAKLLKVINQSSEEVLSRFRASPSVQPTPRQDEAIPMEIDG